MVELAAADLIAGRCVQDSFDVRAGYARQKSVLWLRGRRRQSGEGVADHAAFGGQRYGAAPRVDRLSVREWNIVKLIRKRACFQGHRPCTAGAIFGESSKSLVEHGKQMGPVVYSEERARPDNFQSGVPDMHQLPVVEMELALAEPCQHIGEAVLQDLKQCVDGRVAGPFQLD